MTQNVTEKSLAWPLAMSLALTALGAAVATGAEMHPQFASALGRLILVSASYATFVWFCRDSDARCYSRSRWRNIGFIFLGLLFIPCYLMRTRRGGTRFIALLKLVGFGLLLLVAMVVGLAAGMAIRFAV